MNRFFKIHIQLFWICLIFIPAALLFPHHLLAQTDLPAGDSHEYYYRILQISGLTDDNASWMLRPFLPTNEITGAHPWQEVFKTEEEPFYSLPQQVRVVLYEPVWFQSVNTALPRGNQDGAIWQGRGYNTAVSAGFKLSDGPLHINFRPMVGFSQNREFDLGPFDPPNVRNSESPASPFAYRDFRGAIDYVQRFGPGSYTWFDLGESSVEVRYAGVTIGLSNKMFWSGPGVQNSLQYGYNAPGFRHFRLGTYRPIATPVGLFEFNYLFGAFRTSDYFNDRTDMNLQSVNALTLIYSPRFVEGLSLGASRTFIQAWPATFSDYWDRFTRLFEPGVRAGLQSEESPTGFDPTSNQLISFFMRWVHPESGFELYGEYGRNDHNVDLRDFRLQPNNHRAFQIGLLKSINLSKQRLLAVGFEMTQLEAMRTNLVRGGGHLGGWFTHANIIQGFTNEGQVIGSGIGPGGNVQNLYADYFEQRGSLRIELARIVYHNSRMDQFFTAVQRANPKEVERREVRNVEIMAGIRATAFLDYGIEISAALQQSLVLNQHHLLHNNIFNTRVELVFRKQMRGWLR